MILKKELAEWYERQIWGMKEHVGWLADNANISWSIQGTIL